MQQQQATRSVGLREIAEQLNVSVSLVSKVLNGRLGNSGAKPHTVAAIRAAARSLGYRKNQAAAALVTGRQHVIGAFLHSLGVEGSGICEEIVRGVAAGAALHRQRMMLRFFMTGEEFLGYCPEITPALLDGLIVAGISHPELREQLQEIENSGVPIITIHEEPESEAFENVTVDQLRVGYVATEHLISRGCRRIAHISTHAQRTEGYVQALKVHGLEYRPELVHRVHHYTYSAGEEAIAEFRARGVEYDGLVTHSDQQSMGALNALLRMGKRVPVDVKIIGVDNSPFCKFAIVPLSSVSSEFFVRSQLAVEMLLDKIAGKPVESRKVEPVVHPRASTLDTKLLNVGGLGDIETDLGAAGQRSRASS